MPILIPFGILALILAAVAAGGSSSDTQVPPRPQGTPPLPPGYGGTPGALDVLPLANEPEAMPGTNPDMVPVASNPNVVLPPPPSNAAPAAPALATQETLAAAAQSARDDGDHELAAAIDQRIPAAPTNAAVTQAVAAQAVPTFEEELARQNADTRTLVENALVDGDLTHLPAIRDLSRIMTAGGNTAIASALETHIADMVALSPAITPSPNLSVSITPPPASTAPPLPSVTDPTPAPQSADVAPPGDAVTALPSNAPAPAIEQAVNQDLGIVEPAPAPGVTSPAPVDQAAVNRETARNLAPLVAANIAQRRYSYDRNKLKEIQRLMGLNADGLYGPASEQMLRDLGVANPPRHLFG